MTHTEKHSEIDKALEVLQKLVRQGNEYTRYGDGLRLIGDRELELLRTEIERAKADLADGEGDERGEVVLTVYQKDNGHESVTTSFDYKRLDPYKTMFLLTQTSGYLCDALLHSTGCGTAKKEEATPQANKALSTFAALIAKLPSDDETREQIKGVRNSLTKGGVSDAA